MACYAGSGQSEAEHSRIDDSGQTDIQREVGFSCGVNCMNVVSESQPVSCCNFNDSHSSVRDHCSQCVDSNSATHFNSSHHSQLAACLTKPSSGSDVDKEDADDYDDTENVHHWHNAGTVLRNFLSQTSETNLLFGNDDMLVTNSDIACGQRPADYLNPRAHCPQYSTDLYSNDRQLLVPGKSCSVPAGDLVVLDEDSQTSVIPLFSELRQKISCLDNGCQEDFYPTSWQRRERSKGNKGYSKTSQLNTWSGSSSEESDNHWSHRKSGHNYRQYFGCRRPKSSGRCSEDLWARDCGVESGCYSADRMSVIDSSSRRRRKKSTTDKIRSLVDDKLVNDIPLPCQLDPAKEQTGWHQDGMSFADCLADVESNATDSENTGHVSDNDDEDNDYYKTAFDGDISSSVAPPIACSFHCISPENIEKQSARGSASNVCYIPADSQFCDEDSHCVSSEDEWLTAMRNVDASDHESCSFGGTSIL